MELRQAVLELDSNRVRDLVGTNIDVNYADPSDKCTALHFAASFGDTEMIQFLLSRVILSFFSSTSLFCFSFFFFF